MEEERRAYWIIYFNYSTKLKSIMRVLLLSPYQTRLGQVVEEGLDHVIQESKIIDIEYVDSKSADFIISYGYQYVLSKEIIERVNGRIINLHISFLPWNRGADPNFWSIVEGSPKGVTIHYIDGGIDTGDIVAQRPIEFSADETLTSSYHRLRELIENLFVDNWEAIRKGKCNRVKQDITKGTYHSKVQRKRIFHLLPKGWDTRISQIHQLKLAEFGEPEV